MTLVTFFSLTSVGISDQYLSQLPTGNKASLVLFYHTYTSQSVFPNGIHCSLKSQHSEMYIIFFSFKPHLTISFWAIFWSMTRQTTNVSTGVAKCLARLLALLGPLSAATIMTLSLALMPLTWQWLSTHTITCYRAFTITWNCVFLKKKSSFWVWNHEKFVYLMSTNTHFLH